MPRELEGRKRLGALCWDVRALRDHCLQPADRKMRWLTRSKANAAAL